MAYTQVQAQFTTARTYAVSAAEQAQAFVAALNTTVGNLDAPRFNFDMSWPQAPFVLTPPITALTYPATQFPADSTGDAPDAPDIVFTLESAPSEPALPTYLFTANDTGDVPEPPALADLTLPADPGDWEPPESPVLLSIAIRPFEGVETYPALAAEVSALPADLVLASPTPFAPPTEQAYDSPFMGAIQAELTRRLVAGGTGIRPEVEAQIWARARSREAAVSAANVAEVMRNAETSGFSLPSGAMAAQLREAQKTALGKYAELSTDIAIKQAELEQTNVRHAIEQGVQLESRLIDYTNAMMGRAFDAAKYLAENAVQVYNSLVAQYRANLEKFSAAVTVYRALIDAERAKVDAYSAEVGGERAKVEINRALVDQQKLQIDLRNAEIALYRERLSATKTLLDLDNVRLQMFGERVRAYTAGINAESARVEAFKALTQTNQIRADTYKTSVETYATRMRTLSDVSKTRADTYEAQVRAFSGKVQAYAAKVAAASEQTRTQVSIEGLKSDHAKTELAAVTSNNQLQLARYEAEIKLYEANKVVAAQQAQLISSNYFALQALVADASKVAAQVNSQLAASAYGTIQANASIDGRDSTSTNFNYSGDTSDSRAAPVYT